MKRLLYLATVVIFILGVSLSGLAANSSSKDVKASKKLTKEQIAKLRDVFDNYGCSGCHMYMHKDSTSGPAVAVIAALAKAKTKKWVISWIMNPKKHYKEPDIKALIHQYVEYMPNNGVTKKDAEKLYEYLMAVADGLVK